MKYLAATRSRFPEHNLTCPPFRKVGQRCRREWPLFASALTTVIVAANATWALPMGGEVAAGSASIEQTSAATMSVEQASNSAIIDWQSFGIAQDETVNFAQPSADAVMLNRVLGNDA